MQVANDVASANKLPSSEARPGRRVNNSAAAGKLQGGKLRKNCVKGALERGVQGQQRLAPWSAVMLAILESTLEEVLTAKSRAYAVSALASALEA